jgi:hypothetical protein
MEPDEIKYIANKILQSEKIIDREFTDLLRDQGAVEDFPEGYIKSWIIDRLRELYNLHICYLEAKNLPNYLMYLRKQFEDVANNDDKIYETIWNDPDGMEPSLKFLDQLKSFRVPFKDFQTNQELTSERQRLSEILKETCHILKNAGVKGTSEIKIYNVLLWVVRLYFHTTRNGSKSGFINQFTVYKPDLFIPELKTAIEYKLVRKGQNIESFIDQVRVDASNYTDDHRYDNFIAVIVIDDFAAATEKSIWQSWKEKKFPKNWELILVNNHL